MPNWTDVKVAVTHDDPFMIKKLKEIFDRPEDPFNQIIPMPSDISREPLSPDDRESSNGRNWYDWSLENWGTKWDAVDSYAEIVDDNTLNITFLTAWSPPIPVLNFLVDEFKYNVHAMYLDEGWNYIGEFIDGEEFEYDDVPNAPSHLLEEFGIEELIDAQR